MSSARSLGQRPVGPPERRQHLAGVAQVEEIDDGDVLIGDQVDLQVAHEPGGRHPEVVADQDDRLDVLAVALPQRGDQLRVLLAPPGEQPLLELVEDQQHLLAGAEHPPPPQRGQRIDQARPRGQLGTRLAQRPQQPGLGLLRRRLDVDRQHVLGQPGQQARLDQRRLAAARRAVDQPDLERGVGVGRFDPGLPEPEALGQAVAVAGAGQQLEEEVGVVLVERPQPLGDDLDGRPVGVGPRRRGRCGVASWVEPGGGADRAGSGRGRPGRRLGLEEVPQVLGQVAGRAVSLRRPLRQRLQADPLQLPGDRVVDLAGRAGLCGRRSARRTSACDSPRNGLRPVSSS